MAKIVIPRLPLPAGQLWEKSMQAWKEGAGGLFAWFFSHFRIDSLIIKKKKAILISLILVLFKCFSFNGYYFYLKLKKPLLS